MDATHSVGVIAPPAARRRATGRPALVEHLRRLRENAALFGSLAREAGIDIADSECTPLIPCIVGGSVKALRLSDALLRRGVNADPVLFPAVPEGKARLRFFVTSCHSSEQIRFMVKVLAEELELLKSDTSEPQDFRKHSPSGVADRDCGKPRSERPH
jgi:7-keto-8-aminopelargonate synthetase-like enzyme